MVKTTKWSELLLSLFFGKWKDGLFDIPGYIFKKYCETGEIPSVDKKDCIYWYFLFEDEIRNVIDTYYEEANTETFEANLSDFRKRAIREVIFGLDPEWLTWDKKVDYITADDVTIFMQTISQTRIWSDGVVREQTPILNSYFAWGIADRSNKIEEQIQAAKELEEREVSDEELEEIEKEAWKKNIAPDYRSYVDSINLTFLKRLLTDPLGRSFKPLGWQKELLVNMKRFTFIASSRRSGKCIDPDSKVRMYGWWYKLAKDLRIWDRLLASDKIWYVVVEEKDFFKKDTCEIVLQNGMKKVVSKDHRVPTQKTYSRDWWDLDIDKYVTAENLKVWEDFVPVMYNIKHKWTIVGNLLTSVNEAKLVWYLIWDWSTSQWNNYISIHSKSYRKYIDKIVNVLWFEGRYHSERNMYSIYWATYLRDRFPEIYCKSENKEIPEWFFKVSNHKIKYWLLEWLLNSDWYLQIKSKKVSKDWYNRKKTFVIEYCTVNEKLARQVLNIMNDVWVIWYLRTKKIKSNFDSKNNKARYIYISDVRSLNMIFDNCELVNMRNYSECIECLNNWPEKTNSNIWVIPLNAIKEISKVDKWMKTPRYNFQRWKADNLWLSHWNEYNWNKVIEINDMWKQEVVHLKVSGDSTFWCDDILTHNTYVGTYLCARQFMIPNQVIIYVVPTLRTTGRVPWRYLFNMLKDFPDISFNKADWTITNRKNWSEIQFISGEREGSVRWQSASLLIFDEAAFLTEDVYATAEPLVRTTNGMVYAISTVNPKSPKNWFYYKLVAAEISKHHADSDKYGRRITLWDNPIIPEEEKESIAEEGKSNMKMFNSEWMAEFQDWDAIDFSKFRIIDNKPVEMPIWGMWRVHIRDEALNKALNTYARFIIAHDSAKLKDKPWLVILGVKMGKNAKNQLVQEWCDVIMSWYMDWFEYHDQCKLIMDLRKVFGEKKTDIVIEYNHGWVVVEEIFRRTYNVHVYHIQTVAGNYFNRDGREWRVGKEMLMGKLISAVDRWVLRAFSFMELLRIELETLDTNDTQQKRNNWHHFDIVSALMVGVTFADVRWYMEQYTETAADKTYNAYQDAYPDNHFPIDNWFANTGTDYDRYEKFGY